MTVTESKYEREQRELAEQRQRYLAEPSGLSS